ncbi:shugoshin 2 isoform X2 [Pantherophis guttatus]|nr:shugoshin 2 isoform X2 [Pantherophis guttatus]XP_034286298.1 shugoshin 2 isoform X2 [Pantherophis guttatus]
MNNKILTAIELSTFSECIPKPVTMDDARCSNSGHESKLSKNQIRPTEQYLITPHIVESDGGGKGNLFVCDTHGPFKPISVLSKQVTADHMNMQILHPEQMPKRSEINKMETEFATNIFPEEKQSHMKQISNNTSLDYASSADEYECQSKGHNNPFPIHGCISERKKQTCISSIHPILNNFGTKRDSNCILHLCMARVCSNDIGNQRDPNGVSHIELTSQPSSKLVYMNKEDLIKSQKSEETIYDTDMELTASELGEIVIIKSRDKKLNKVKADKISGNLRKVTLASTEKHIKKKIAMNQKKSDQNVSKTIQTIKSKKKLPLKVELFEKTTSWEMELKNANEEDGEEDNKDINKNYKHLHLIDLNCQLQTTNILESEKEEKIMSETVEGVIRKNPAENFEVSTIHPTLLQDSKMESLLPLASPIMDKQENLNINESYPDTSKINRSNYYEMESMQHLRNLKRLGSEECRYDCQTKHGQRTTVKCVCSSKEVTCKHNITAEGSTDALDVSKILQSDKRRIFAKASRKTYIIYPGSHNEKKMYVKQKLHNQKLYDKNIPHKASEEEERIFSVQRVISCALKDAEISNEAINEKEGSTSKPSRKTYFVSMHDQNKKENIPVINKSERHNQEENDCDFTKKADIIYEELCNRKPMQDSGNKPLQELTNIGINSNPKSKKDIEEHSEPPVRLRRTTVCYKEPSIQSKLRRREDATKDTILNFPVFKVKDKQNFKTKPRLI